MREEGWLQPGDTCVDPFGGVSLGGLDAALHGIRHVAVELELKFHQLALENIALWQRRYGHLQSWVTPVVLQGDSRFLSDLLAKVDGCVCSTPYSSDGLGHKRGATADDKEWATKSIHATTYGTHPAQLGNMNPGSFDAALSSPPYANGCAHTGGSDPQPQHIQGG